MRLGDLLIQNAVVVNSKTCTPADILIRDGKIEHCWLREAERRLLR